MEVNIDNMKKLFSGKKITKKSFMEFFDRKGFYIVLAMCIVIVGATAVFITINNPSSLNDDLEDDKLISDEPFDYIPELADGFDENAPIGTPVGSSLDENVAEDASETVSGTEIAEGEAKVDADKKAEVDKKAEGEIASKEKPTDKPKEKTASNVVAAANKTTAKPVTTSKSTDGEGEAIVNNQKFVMPVIGEVTFDYAREKLVYSKTLEDWRTHDGVDIAAERGTPVKAVSDGVITDIKHDPRFGITIIIDHQNGLKTVYANLASDEMVNPNQLVKQDEIIGSVGNTAIFESAEQSHLHFEVLKDDKLVDPNTYLTAK